ncbi:hypothetical protein [uncultured Stenotrophomonas sp.]|uniref:hypothetical protein n=1 Tax=uncultured Stenotrophomonas sp. TaxID=165438 RepID=UPI0025E6AD1F|nr:hypothetical protein [uncultured Stenotrophomonas sp.]
MHDGHRPRKTGCVDFWHFDTREKCEAAVRRLELAFLHLLPEELGGECDADNMVFVPTWVAEQKRRIDTSAVLPLMRAGKLSRYAASPTYRGKSFIPAEITIHAYDPAGFATTIDIW